MFTDAGIRTSVQLWIMYCSLFGVAQILCFACKGLQSNFQLVLVRSLCLRTVPVSVFYCSGPFSVHLFWQNSFVWHWIRWSIQVSAVVSLNPFFSPGTLPNLLCRPRCHVPVSASEWRRSLPSAFWGPNTLCGITRCNLSQQCGGGVFSILSFEMMGTSYRWTAWMRFYGWI